MKFVYSFCVVILFLACCTNSAEDHDAAVPPKVEAGGICQNVKILMASNASTGIQVILASTEDTNDSPPMNFMIAGHYLPPECRVNNHLCSVLHFGHPNGTSHYIVPSIRGFVVLSLWDNRTDELPWKSFINVTENCNPTKAFLTRQNRILIIACMDLQSRPEGILYYINYDLFPNSTGSGWTVVRNAALPTRSEKIYNPATVSEIIHVHGQARCPRRDNLYYTDDSYVVRFPTSHTSDPEFEESFHQLQNCMGYQSFEYHGNDNLVIRCSNNRTVLYDSCVTGRFTYTQDDRIPYPCTNWGTVAYRNGTQLTFDGATQQLPSSDINYGKCIHGVERPIFIASSANGSIFITRFDGNNFTKIASGNCSNDNNMPCPRPVFSESEHVFGTFNSETGSFVIINVTEKCMDDPVIAQIPIPFVPDLVSVSLGQGTYNCSCSAIQNTEPLSTTTQTEFTPQATQTKPTTMQLTGDARQTESTMATDPSESTFSAADSSSNASPISTATHPSESTSAADSSNASSISTKGLLAGVIVAVLLSLAVTAIIILVFLVCKFSCLNHTKEFPPTVQSLPESIQVHVSQSHCFYHINNPVDPSDRSGITTATTSVSESDGIASSTSGESEHTVSFHAESGSETCMDSTNDTVDQCGGRSDSSGTVTTPTASVSESNGTTSYILASPDESAEIVSFEAETGQPGGVACRYIISRDTYPLNCTQISADQVCENIHSRTADNRDREDMDTKVQVCKAEDNNRES